MATLTTAASSSAPVVLSAYNSLSATLQFGAASSATTIAVSDAINDGDVSPNTMPTDNATSNSLPELYLSFYNASGTTVTFGSATPTVQLSDNLGFGGATVCELDDLSGGVWGATGATGTISGTSVTINSIALANQAVFQFQPGQTLLAIACR